MASLVEREKLCMQGRGGECEGLVGMAASGKEWSVEQTVEKICLDCNYTRIYAFPVALCGYLSFLVSTFPAIALHIATNFKGDL